MKSNNAWIPELKENMRRTTNTVLEINKLLKEVRPLSEETPQCSKSDPLNDLDEDDPRYVLNTFFSINNFFQYTYHIYKCFSNLGHVHNTLQKRRYPRNGIPCCRP